MIKSLLVGLILLATAVAEAQDLESLFAGEPTKQEKAAKEEAVVDASLFGYFRKSLQSQNIQAPEFLQAIAAKNWTLSLSLYPAVSQNEDDKALFRLIQYRAGLKITALENLFKIDIKKLSAPVKGYWSEAVREQAPFWSAVNVAWTTEWVEVFGKDEAFVASVYSLNSKEDIAELEKLVAQTLPETSARYMAEWKLALAYGASNQVEKAARILGLLAKLKNPPVSLALLNLTAGRMLYQNGYFTPAIKYYEKIDRTSEYWLEAQEELAWSYLRKGEPQNALAMGKTITHPALSSMIGPEAYFVNSLANLKVCNYSAVMQGLTQFSPRFKDRTMAMQSLSENAKQASVDKFLAMLKEGRLQDKQLGGDLKKLPRFITRDEVLFHLMQVQKALDAEAKAAEALGEIAKADKEALLARSQAAVSSAYARIQELAKEDVAETKEILRKLHIVEAEVIQRVALFNQVKKDMKTDAPLLSGSTGAQGPDVIKFIADNNEVWIDEINTYKVDVKKACQAKR